MGEVSGGFFTAVSANADNFSSLFLSTENIKPEKYDASQTPSFTYCIGLFFIGGVSNF